MSQVAVVEDIYEGLLEISTNSRQRESLERIKKACDYLEEQRSEISPSSVARYCIDRGWPGPKAQSIRNSEDVLWRYIRARSSRQQLAPKKNRAAEKPKIADESIRAYVAMLQDERDEAVAARRRIETGLRSIPGVPVDDLIRVGFGGKAAEPVKLAVNFQLPHVAREALMRLMDANALSDAGLQLHKDRLRQASTGNVLLEKAHVLALRELLGGKPDATPETKADEGAPE